MESEDNAIETRLRALEQRARLTSPRRSTAGVSALFLGLLLVLLCWNVWLLRSQIAAVNTQSKERLFWALCHEEATTEERARAMLRLISEGNTEWRSAHLARLDLSGAQLAGVSLESANLEYCKFTHANLSRANLTGCNLRAVDLAEANLQESSLGQSDLLRANLSKASLRKALLSGASLDQANLEGADLVRADLTETFLSMANFTDADLAGADLRDAILDAAVLRNVNLALALVTRVNIADTDFTNCNWWRARGFTEEQIEMLKQKFPPNADAPQSVINDFELWSGKASRPVSETRNDIREES